MVAGMILKFGGFCSFVGTGPFAARGFCSAFFVSVQTAGLDVWPRRLLLKPGDFVFKLPDGDVLMLDNRQQLLNQWRSVFLRYLW